MDSLHITSTDLEQVRKNFYDRGLEVTAWARANGFHAASVYRVLNGQSRARRGASHHIAVALGLKPPPPESSPSVSPPGE